jgi:hypothetical protein
MPAKHIGNTTDYPVVTPANVDTVHITQGGVSKQATVLGIGDVAVGVHVGEADPHTQYGLQADPLSQFAATTSAQLAGVISDETGSGALVFATSPTLVTPALGTPSALTLTNATGLPVAGGGTGVATLTAYAPIFGGTTGTGAVQSGAVGSAGEVLTSNGAGALPTFQAPAGGGSVATDAIWDAAGDLAVGSGANTAARLAMGTALQTLRVNAGATALEWATPSGGSTQGRHAVYIAAGAMQPALSAGSSGLTPLSVGASQPEIATLNFDATTQESAHFSLTMPKSWNEGTVTFAPIWSHASTTTNFGVVWSLRAVAFSNDDTMAASFGTAVNSTDTGGTTNDLYVGPESSAMTIGGSPAAEDTVFFRMDRVPSDGGDTIAIDARLHGIVLFITTDAETDA